MTTATYSKLKSGNWGIRIQGSAPPVGTTVQVVKRDGTTKTERIAKVVWEGNGIALCAIEPAAAPVRAAKGRRTGCACGSREDSAGDLIWSENNCKSCNFDAYDM